MSSAERAVHLELNKTEAESALWKKISAHYEQRLDILRRKNDNALTPEETAALRGRIAEVKKLLASAGK